MMKITFLDAATLGEDISTDLFSSLGEVKVWSGTTAEQADAHIEDSDVIVLNKVKINAATLEGHPNLKLICITATGYDNVDLEACRERGVAVCNVVGYSTQSVAQLTVLMALTLLTRLEEYQSYVRDGSYTASGIANRLVPVYSEIFGKTWGIVGYGNIGQQVARVAAAMGCRTIVHKRTPTDDAVCVDFDTICRESDILSFHTPLNDGTRGMLDEAHVAMLKPNAIVINVARGAVTDEKALADAVKEGKIAGLGVDVYSAEPLPKDHPFTEIMHLPNVCLTPHMAWGAYETRMRLLEEVLQNVRSFLEGGNRNRLV
ncbi:MAG: hydroxyacid dehydrogenase [Clostridia bacterium]|nr:hydroxyacid dehydrogenase [Clostridia bacterium]